MQDAFRRLSHPHYVACSLLCLPFPLTLAVRLTAAHDLAPSFTTALLAAPVLLALAVAVRKPSDNIGQSVNPLAYESSSCRRDLTDSGPLGTESFCETTTFQLRLLNLFGFAFTRNQLGTGWRAVVGYFALWMGESLPSPVRRRRHPLQVLTIRNCSRVLLFAATGLPRTFQVANPLDRGAKKEENLCFGRLTHSPVGVDLCAGI